MQDMKVRKTDMSELLPDGGTIRKLWVGETDAYRDIVFWLEVRDVITHFKTARGLVRADARRDRIFFGVGEIVLRGFMVFLSMAIE